MSSRTLRLGALTAALLVLASTTFADDVIDQSNDPTTTKSYACGAPPFGNATLLQSFVPTMSPLTAVELRLRVGAAFPSEDLVTTARIRVGDPKGDVLGEATATIAGGQTAMTQLVVRYDFDAIEVTPGDTYLIEWVTPPSDVVTWMGLDSDPYANGTAYSCIGSVWPGGGTDFNFVTYSEEATQDVQALLKSLCEKTDALLEDRGRGCHRGWCMLLKAASRSVERGHYRAAINQMHAYQQRLHALETHGHGTEALHDVVSSLAADADAIIALLQEKLPTEGHQRKHSRHQDCGCQ